MKLDLKCEKIFLYVTCFIISCLLAIPAHAQFLNPFGPQAIGPYGYGQQGYPYGGIYGQQGGYYGQQGYPYGGYYGGQTQNYADADVDVDANDDGDTIKVDEGDIISIILSSNASTGYSWVHDDDDDDYDDSIVDYEDDNYFAGSSYLVGAGGTEQWLFEVKGSVGETTTITLEYKRTWDGDISDTFEIEVEIVD